MKCICSHRRVEHSLCGGRCTACHGCPEFTPDDGTDGPESGTAWERPMFGANAYRYESSQAGEGISL